MHLHLAKIFHEAGIPKGVLNTVTGRGSEIGDYFVTHHENRLYKLYWKYRGR